MVGKWGKKRSVKRRYDLTAHIYNERYCEEQEAKYQAALENLNLSPDGIVLDAGCGSGLFFSQIAGKSRAVVGLDISLELLLLAKKASRKFGNVFLVLADADNLPFRSGVFDCVFAFTVLQNMPNPVETLRELQISASRNACFAVTGLKASFSIEKFDLILKKAGLSIISLSDNEVLRCYVVTAVRSPK